MHWLWEEIQPILKVVVEGIKICYSAWIGYFEGVLTGVGNIINGVVNKVKIYEEDQYLGVVQDDELISLMGTFQEIYTKEEDKQARTVAQNMLQGITREAEVTVQGNTNCISGKAIRVEDLLTKLVGSFYIESVEHQWNKGH